MRFHLLHTIDPLNWMMKVIDFCLRGGENLNFEFYLQYFCGYRHHGQLVGQAEQRRANDELQ